MEAAPKPYRLQILTDSVLPPGRIRCATMTGVFNGPKLMVWVSPKDHAGHCPLIGADISFGIAFRGFDIYRQDNMMVIERV